MAEENSTLQIIGKRSLRLALIVLPLAAIANIALFVWSVGDRSYLSLAASPHWLVLALVFSFVPWLTNTLRLLIWARFFELDLGVRQAFRIILGTVLGNAVTPTATGAPAVKWAFMVHEDISPDKATTLIGLQTAEDSFVSIGLLTAAAIAAVSFDIPAMFPGIDWLGSAAAILRNIVMIVLGILAVVGILLISARSGILGTRARDAAHKLTARLSTMLANSMTDWKHAFQSGRQYLLASTLLAVLQWTTRHSIAALVIGFIGGQMMPLLHWALQWLVFTASSIVPSPGGAGGTEASFLLFFAPFLSVDLLGPAMVIWRVTIFYIPAVIAGAIFLALHWHKPVRGRQGRP